MTSSSNLSQPIRGWVLAVPPSLAWWAGLAIDWRAGWVVVAVWAIVLGPLLAVGLLVAEVRVVEAVEGMGAHRVAEPTRTNPNDATSDALSDR